MRLKLFMLLSLFLSLNVMAQTGLRGIVIDSRTNVPVTGATVLLDEQGASAITGPRGDFVINDARPGNDRLLIFCYGYRDLVQDVVILNGIDDLISYGLIGSRDRYEAAIRSFQSRSPARPFAVETTSGSRP